MADQNSRSIIYLIKLKWRWSAAYQYSACNNSTQ